MTDKEKQNAINTTVAVLEALAHIMAESVYRETKAFERVLKRNAEKIVEAVNAD